jgi:hypothetical protein
MVRMNSGSCEQLAAMRARQFDGPARAFLARAGHDHLHNAGKPGAPEHGVAIRVEAVVRKVDADIDEFQRSYVFHLSTASTTTSG